MLPDLKAGIYRHYKGRHYLVLGYGHDATIAGRTVVVYCGLELEDAKPGPRLACRTADEFLGDVSVGGVTMPRFEYVGPEYAT
jgi:hypothetical protein